MVTGATELFIAMHDGLQLIKSKVIDVEEDDIEVTDEKENDDKNGDGGDDFVTAISLFNIFLLVVAFLVF